jgi:hypothetical protein
MTYAQAGVTQMGLAPGRSNPAYDTGYCAHTNCVDMADLTQVDNDIDSGVEGVVGQVSKRKALVQSRSPKGLNSILRSGRT